MRAMGIILAGGHNPAMRELSRMRATSAMPVGGSFRAIDFALSSMSNSGIQTVTILTQYNARSLNMHLNSPKWWNYGRKQGGLYVFTPTVTPDNGEWFRGTADAIYQNIDFLRLRHEPYVVISSGDCIYKLDLNAVLDYHESKHADITIVCKEMPKERNISRFGTVDADEEGRVIRIEEKPQEPRGNVISTGIYVIRRRKLIELLEQVAAREKYDLVRDILIEYYQQKKIYAYMMDSYWSNIAELKDYYDTNMDFLKPEVRKAFFREKPMIYTKVDDLPPAKFNPGSSISNSLIASGCIVSGTVENSLVFRQAVIGRNCTIRNCVILNDVYIGDDSYLENCIVEAHSTINSRSFYKGEGEPQVVAIENYRYLMP